MIRTAADRRPDAVQRPHAGGVRLQRKLVVGSSRDPLERDADRAADVVTGVRSTHTSPAPDRDAAVDVRRDTGGGVQLAEPAPPSVDRALARPGASLEPGTRREMEQRFGHDFSRVRVHAGGDAERSAEELGARAYTVGSDIVFGAGQYAPRTRAGSWLLAHELAHVVQQSSTVRPYRDSASFNFGKQDDATLVESSFDPKTDKETKPWIRLITVEFTSTHTDADGYTYWKGTATAQYYDNPVKKPDLGFSVSGGSSSLGKTDAGSFTVHRIEGVGYNSGSFSGTPGVDYDPAQREGPRKRYSKSLIANMSYAVFYNKGEALHAGPTSASSHGCVHVGWSDIKQVNYHSVIGLTKVKVKYSPP